LGCAYKFPGLQQIAFVRRIYWDGGKKISDGRYFLTSIPRNRLSARKFLKKVKAHWEVENCLHNVKDKLWNEDKQYTIRTSLGCAQSTLRNASLNLLRLVKIPITGTIQGMSAKGFQLLAQPLQAFQLLSKI
jgi:hypothetical protein